MNPMSENVSPEERIKRFQMLSSEERKKLIRKKLKLLGLEEGSGVRRKDDSSYKSDEITDLILLTRCLKKFRFNKSSK